MNSESMNKKSIALAFLMATLLCNSIQAQKSVSPEDALPSRGQIPFQRFKTDGKDIFLVRWIENKDAPPVEVKRTRLVPEKTAAGIRYRKVTETALTPALKEQLIAIGEHYVFQKLDGKKLDKLEMIKRLGMGEGKLIVSLMPGQRIPDAWHKLLKKDALVFSISPPVKKE